MPRAHGPWTILSSERKYRDGFVDVVLDQVLQPDGQPGQYVTVRVAPGVGVLPVDGEGRVYLVRQFRYALGAESLEVVQGGVEGGEDPRETARRELKEELGIEAKEWVDLGIVQLDTSIVCCPLRLFVAKGLTFDEPEREGSEAMTGSRLGFEEARQAVLDGRITDAATSVLLLKALAAGAI